MKSIIIDRLRTALILTIILVPVCGLFRVVYVAFYILFFGGG